MSGLTTPSAAPSTSSSSYPSTHIATPVSVSFPNDTDTDTDQTDGVDGDDEKLIICTKEHAFYCFEVLVDHFKQQEQQHGQGKNKLGFGLGLARKHKSSSSDADSSEVKPTFKNKDDKYALFVTWNTNASHRANRKPALRGCIGNFSPMRLEDGLREYALISAFDDHRFSPIKASELPNLSCNVSLLTPFTSIPDPLAWTPGVHGIHITFPHPNTGRSLSATYLPEIAKEQGWSRTETILSAISKAGYHSNNKVDPEDEDDPVWSRLKVKVYESQKATADWGEYLGWKESRDRDKEGSSDHVAEGDDEGEENVFGNGIEIGRKTNDNVKVNTKVKAKARN